MKNALVYILFAWTFASCTKQRDLYIKAPSMLMIQTDWKHASVEPGIWTGMFYNGSKYALTLTKKRDSIAINDGNYEAIAVNGTLANGIDYVRFRNTDQFDTFEAYATAKTQNTFFTDYGKNILLNDPDTLYGTSVYKDISSQEGYYIKYRNGRNGFFVPNNHFGDTVKFVPERLTYKVNVVARLHAFANAAKNTYIIGNLNGFASSVFVGTGLPSHQTAFQEFRFMRPATDVATFEASATYNSFGPPIDLKPFERRYYVRLKLVLRDGTFYDRIFDLSDQVEAIITRIKQEHIKEFTLYITDTLPDAADSNIDVGVFPWEDEIRIPIPVYSKTCYSQLIN